MNINKKAFLLIEVLISFILISLVIISINLIYKQYTIISFKKKNYSNLYITVQSVINKINSYKLYQLNSKKNLQLNNFKIKIEPILFKKVDKKYRIFYLYKFIVLLSNKNFKSKFIIYRYLEKELK